MPTLTDPRARARPAERRKREIERAVLRTLVYSDLFDFPLTAAEMATYLFDFGASEAAVTAAARGCVDVVELDGYFCLRGRQAIVAGRLRRRPENARQWRKARHYAALLAALPFIRMVSVTGSLAPGNSRPGDDIDLLLVTAPGRLWLARLLVLTVVRGARLLGDELCPNFLLAETSLAIDGSAFPAYYARELSQMVPLFGAEAYAALRLANGWTAALLPNANHVVRRDVPCRPGRPVAAAKRWAEAVLGSRPFDRLEALEGRRKAARLVERQRREGGVLECSSQRCRGHFGRYAERMMELFELRCAALAEISAV
ncbi:MAG: hypothetical protein ACYDAG_09985 [Chloroflexota bacterium]